MIGKVLIILTSYPEKFICYLWTKICHCIDQMINFSKIFDNFLHSFETVISFRNINFIEFHVWFSQFLHNSRSIGIIQINNSYFSSIIYKSSNKCWTNSSTSTSYNCYLYSKLFLKIYFGTKSPSKLLVHIKSLKEYGYQSTKNWVDKIGII